MNLASEPIVGRGPELRTVDEVLDGDADGGPTLVEFAGEPGIGKSRLLAELAARARERGDLVLSGSASELEQELPFWLFVDALDDDLAASEPARLRALDDDTRAELGHVFPALLRCDGELADAPQERFRTHLAVRQLLEALARPKPLVLALDDLHWADSGSIELLAG